MLFLILWFSVSNALYIAISTSWQLTLLSSLIDGILVRTSPCNKYFSFFFHTFSIPLTSLSFVVSSCGCPVLGFDLWKSPLFEIWVFNTKMFVSRSLFVLFCIFLEGWGYCCTETFLFSLHLSFILLLNQSVLLLMLLLFASCVAFFKFVCILSQLQVRNIFTPQTPWY